MPARKGHAVGIGVCARRIFTDGNRWPDMNEKAADAVFETLEQFAPGITSSVLHGTSRGRPIGRPGSAIAPAIPIIWT